MSADLEIPDACRPTADQRQSDGLGFKVREDDLRVVHGGWVHTVTCVHEEDDLTGDSRGAGAFSWGGGDGVEGDGFVAFVVLLALQGLLVPWRVVRGRRRRRRGLRRAAAVKAWECVRTVGVIRSPDPRGWGTDVPKVVHSESIEIGVDHRPLMLELAHRAAAGEFSPETPRTS